MGENLTIRFLSIVIIVLVILMIVQIFTAVEVRRKTDVILQTITETNSYSTKDRKVLHEKVDDLQERLKILERR